jgi:hypothetical protein
MRPLSRFAVAAALAVSVVPLYAASSLTYSIGGAAKAVRWPASAFPIAVTVDRRVTDSFGLATVERAFDAWAAVPDVAVGFKPLTVVDGIRASQDNVNSVSMADGLFANQGFIAVTTNWYDDTATISEADIQIDPSAGNGSYNVQSIVEHEVGHFLGLDHSAVLSAVMYPYVSRTTSTDLDSDDTIAIAGLYPKGNPTLTGATLKGKVVGNEGVIFAAQVVAVNERGEPVATGLTDASGEFMLQGLPTGDYRVYAEPLDGPVEPRNLDGVYRNARVTSFPTTFASASPLHVSDGNIYGSLVVNGSGAPVQLNPKWVGVAAADSSDFTLVAAPVTVRPGQTFALALGGDGFTSGMTTFEVLSPAVQRTSDFHYAANFAWANFHVADSASSGAAIVMARSGNESATLTGALRIVGSSSSRNRAARK